MPSTKAIKTTTSAETKNETKTKKRQAVSQKDEHIETATQEKQIEEPVVKAKKSLAKSKKVEPVETATKVETVAKVETATKVEPATKTKKSLKKSKKTEVVETAKSLKSQKETQGNEHEDISLETGIKKRNFKCIMINSEGGVECTGRYSGRKPKQAGNKACTRIFKNFNGTDQKVPEKVIFGMHECTRGSKHKKKYFYIGSRERLDTPLHIKINKIDPVTNNRMVISYNYNYFVKKLTDTECNEYGLLVNYDSIVDKVIEEHTAKVTEEPVKLLTKEDTAPVVIEEGNVKVSKKTGTKKTERSSKKAVKKSA